MHTGGDATFSDHRAGFFGPDGSHARCGHIRGPARRTHAPAHFRHASTHSFHRRLYAKK